MALDFRIPDLPLIPGVKKTGQLLVIYDPATDVTYRVPIQFLGIHNPNQDTGTTSNIFGIQYPSQNQDADGNTILAFGGQSGGPVAAIRYKWSQDPNVLNAVQFSKNYTGGANDVWQDIGEPGEPGAPGLDGKSAYQSWLEVGNAGDVQDFIDSLQGPPGGPGVDGKSAYQSWLDLGNAGTEQDFIDSLQGEPGTWNGQTATNDEEIAGSITNKVSTPGGRTAWFTEILASAGVYFSQKLAAFKLELGLTTTAGTTRTIEVKGVEPDIDFAVEPKGNGALKSSKWAGAGNRIAVFNAVGKLVAGDNPENFLAALDLGNIIYVSPQGNNATGTKGRIDKPYQTIQAAISSVSNIADLVIAMPGTYNEDILSNQSQSFVGLLLEGATVNGNININNNTGTNRIILHNGGTINGDFYGTFGCVIRGDKSGTINGTWQGANGGLDINNIYEWKYSGSGNMVAIGSTNPNAIENVFKITHTGTGYFFSFGNTVNIKISNVDTISTPSDLIYNFTGDLLTINGGFQNIRKIVCKSVILAPYRPLTFDFLDRVNFFVTNAAAVGTLKLKHVTDCEFISTHATEPFFAAYQLDITSLYNCKFKSGGGAFINIDNLTTGKIGFINFVTNFNPANLVTGTGATVINSNVVQYADLNIVR